jgi:hypothetical protein
MSWNPGKLPFTPEEFDAMDEGQREPTPTYLVVAGVIAVVVILAVIVWSVAT